MANAREILNRIKSIQDTMKITKAMYMVSSMKVQKAKKNLENTLPYFQSLQEQMKDILIHFPEMSHLYFDNRFEDEQETVKRRLYVVISGDKGMAGAYNLNVLKEARRQFDTATEYRIYAVGETGRHAFMSEQRPVAPDFRMSSNNPSVYRARVMAETLLQQYKDENVDEIYVIYTKMKNSIQSEVKTEQLLPFRTTEFLHEELLKHEGPEAVIKEDMSYMEISPSPEEVLETIVRNTMTGFLYGALVESLAAEESARMFSMQTATDNANAMLTGLSKQFNQIRQAAITQEITEVVSGAKAAQRKKNKKRQLRVMEET